VDPTQVAASGPLLLASGIALLAGLVSFASPCVMPLVPGYLAYLAALVGADAAPVTESEAARSRRSRFRLVGAVALFILGFTAVFAATIGGIVWLADSLLVNQELLQRIGGVLTIAMALVFIGLVPAAQREIRSHAVPRIGLAGAPVLGAVFGLGWTPCIGPTLAGVLSIAAGTGGDAARGLLLVGVYCLGLGVPFMLIALGAGRAVRATAWLRVHRRGIQLAGGGLLLVVGVLLVTGLWAELTGWLRDAVVTDVKLPI